jgi:hypothetical protein
VTQTPFVPDRFDALEIALASLRLMESTLAGMRQVRQYVGEAATEILDSLIEEAEVKIGEIKRRVVN